MRLMSFLLTEAQMLAQTKTVTRRMGWLFLTKGDWLQAVRKGQGLRKGEHVVRLGMIWVTGVTREPLSAITQDEVNREGFPEMTPAEFVQMFCRTHDGCTPSTEVTRIEFRHVGAKP